jgi:hypothetical protein
LLSQGASFCSVVFVFFEHGKSAKKKKRAKSRVMFVSRQQARGIASRNFKFSGLLCNPAALDAIVDFVFNNQDSLPRALCKFNFNNIN